MTDEHERRAAGGDEALQPADGLNVEVVGRLVQQEDIGALQEELRQLDTHAPAAREDRGRALEITALEAQPEERALDVGLEVARAVHQQEVRALGVALDELHIALAVVVGALGHLGRQLRYLLLQLGDVTEDLLALLQHGALVAELHHLRQVADLQPFGEGDRPLRRGGDTCQELEKGGLTRPVLAHEGDALPR